MTVPYHPQGIRFGAAYYLEYQPDKDVDRDLDLMQAAGFTVIRVGESVWSTWEPSDGVFDLDWLQPVLDGAHRRGIGVILGTPTYAAPPWLAHAYPEIAGEVKTGQRYPWGARQEIDITHPAFLFHAERVSRKIVARYADHPAVIGYQVDNEPGVFPLHNRGTFIKFLRWLKARYGTVEKLNEEWGLVYWSHRIQDWDELWRPDGNAQPQYDLAWRTFQDECTSEFIAWQADIVREYARDDQFVTTCTALDRATINEAHLNAPLDIAAANPYFAVQDNLEWGNDRPRPDEWVRTGVHGLLELADRAYGIKQGRFLVTETNAQAIQWASWNYPPYPGQLTQAGLALVARGAAMIEYWHWHTLHFGTETYWGGVLPHSQQPGRVYDELAGLGRQLAAIGTRLDDYVPDADIAILWDTATKHAYDFNPPLHLPGGAPNRFAYRDIVGAFQRGAVEAGAQIRIVNMEQFREIDPAELAAQYPVLVAAVFVTTDDDLSRLAAYAEAGGTLIVGPRTGYGDEEARARHAVAPDVLRPAAGVCYEEFSNLAEPLPVQGEGWELSPGAAATQWLDGYRLEGAEVLASYDHHYFGAFPAVTSKVAGSGRVVAVGTVPNPAFAVDLFRRFIPTPASSGWERDPSVTVLSGRTPDGPVWFLHNWSKDPAAATVPVDCTGMVDGAAHRSGDRIELGPWGVTVLAG